MNELYIMMCISHLLRYNSPHTVRQCSDCPYKDNCPSYALSTVDKRKKGLKEYDYE